ncbi:MAG TPA: ribose 5-phosphate isomerase B [Candidatus Nanopelagicaceae bacterium]|nr:ribose 5-phosphate isomerase B [Candidatus Nanopelagicaceae bacterium]
MTIRIAIGSDHAGYQLKEFIGKQLNKQGYTVTDVGTYSAERTDYPEYGAAVGRLIVGGQADFGALVCGSGVGICIAANKIPGIRAGVAHDVESARLMRAHNDAQIICFGERNTTPNVAILCLEAFLATDFEGGRHGPRVEQLNALDIEREGWTSGV